ncbi:MAG: imidazolonepropionase, partial [Myxococcota bacterium]
CHTHLVFAGSRVDEFARRMAGEDYRAIAATGGGIGSTVRATRAASDETLFEHARRRALRLRRGGATTIEVKSGYGLTVEDELRLLRVARQLEDEGIVRVSPTFLGAHLVPEKFRDRRSEYVDLVAGPMLEQVVEEQLATSIDVYLDDGAFTRDEAARILHAGQGEGLMVRAHVGQFQDLGGAELVAELGGVSADHLEVVSDEGAAALAAAETVGVLLPGAWSTLRQTPPDVERLRRHGVRLAVGSDCNPGTSPMADLSLAAALAVRNAGLTIEEAILGMTRWAAKALGREDIGRIDVGARADLILLESDDPRTLGYALGASEPALVILDGKVVEEPASAAPTW